VDMAEAMAEVMTEVMVATIAKIIQLT